MGYRFTLETANTVANLTFGKVLSCYRDIYSSYESYYGFLQFVEKFQQNMHSNDIEHHMHRIHMLRDNLQRFEDYDHYIDGIENNDVFMRADRSTLDALRDLSDIFSRCSIKSILLPRMIGSCNNNVDDSFMTSERTLERLVHRHPGDSCLILQPEERPSKATIFDAFPNFEVALRQADLWPAVLFWEGDNDFAFIPIKDEPELYNLYEIVRYDRHPIVELKRIAERKKKSSYYILQLSDLHFGAQNVNITERRLKSLIKTQIAALDPRDYIEFVITGDAVDSPNLTTENDYREFSEYIEEHYGRKPIRVLGNHDINNAGLAFFHGRQSIANIVGEYPKIVILDDPKVILLLFNSNTNGNLAEGEIGTEQMAEMGNKLDGVKNLKDYLLIAVMHHHLLPIPRPDYYEKRWFERILSGGFIDESLKLIDADLFLEWLQQRNVKVVIHGHKHIPFIADHKGIHVIACGSSTGQITHKERGKTYISYNLLKVNGEIVTCTQFAEELLGAGAKNIRTEIIH